MRIPDRVETSFALLQADWDVDKGRHMLERLKPTHAIVHRGGTDYYYLYPVAAIRSEIDSKLGTLKLWSALDLREDKATPLVSINGAQDAPGPSVVHAGGRVVGFLEARPEWQRTETLAKRAAPAGEPGFAPRTRNGGGEEAAAAPTATAVAAAETTEHTLTAEFPKRIVKDTVASLLVSLTAAAVAGGLPISLPVGTVIDILVQARRGLVVEGDPQGSLTVGAGDTLPFQFKLRAVELGPAQVRVLAFHRGQALGALDLAPLVVEAAEADTTATPARLPESQALAPIAVQVPDLALFVEERGTAGGYEYGLRVTASNQALKLNLKPFGPLQLKVDPTRFFQEFFQDVERIPAGTDQATVARMLAGRGSYLFQTIFPKDLQEQLWALRASIKSVIIQSEEPWIPWEIFRFCGLENGRIVEGPFLCEAYEVTRWVPGLGFQQPLTMKNIAVVVPDDTGLPKAAEERDYVLSLQGDGRKVTRVPATAAAVTEALASGEYDCWHFTGHGLARDQNPDRSSMVLQAAESLLPEEISGTVSNLGLARPLVFLNACQIGRGGISLTGVGGFTRRFLEAGAGAFIGTYWSVYDQPAIDFAKAVYSRLLGGIPIARAVKEARGQIKSSGDATWLAYTVFADPLAAVKA